MNEKVIYLMLLAFVFLPVLVSATIDTSQFLCNAATIQREKTLYVGVGQEVETMIGFFNIHGTRIAHVTIQPEKYMEFVINVTPPQHAEFVMSIEPNSSSVAYNVSGIRIESVENLAVDPIDLDDLPKQLPVGNESLYTKIDGVDGYVPIKFATLRIFASKITSLGKYKISVPITISCFDSNSINGKTTPLVIDRTMQYEVNVVPKGIAFTESLASPTPVVTLSPNTVLVTKNDEVSTATVLASSIPSPIYVAASTGLFTQQNGNLILGLLIVLLAIAGYYAYSIYYKGGERTK